MQGVKGTGSAAERRKRWADKNPGYDLAAKQKDWRARHPGYLGPKRQALVDMVAAIKEASPCADCGSKFPACCMDFDHRGTDKHSEIGTLIAKTSATQVVLDEIAKCDLVCANCHRIRTRDRGSSGWSRKPTLHKDELPKALAA